MSFFTGNDDYILLLFPSKQHPPPEITQSNYSTVKSRDEHKSISYKFYGFFFSINKNKKLQV